MDPQQEVIQQFTLGQHNVLVSAPGTGKTHLLLELLKRNPDKQTCIVMYNAELRRLTEKRLRQETWLPRSQYGVFTYHSLVTSWIHEPVTDSWQFKQALEKLEQEGPSFLASFPPWPLKHMDVLFIDEAQDMTEDYFRLIRVLLLDICTKGSHVQIVVGGDPCQLLYDFYPLDPADARFLLLWDELWQEWWPKTQFSVTTLRRSYRMSPQVASFVNILLYLAQHPQDEEQEVGPRRRSKKAWQTTITQANLSRGRTEGEAREYKGQYTNLQGVHVSGPPVRLVIGDLYMDAPEEISRHVTSQNQGQSLLLCHTTNEHSPLIPVVNRLLQKGIDVELRRSGSGEKPQDDLVPRKQRRALKQTKLRPPLKVMTLFAAKGLEADRVFVVNTKPLDLSDNNPLFVGLTRARTFLHVFQDYRWITPGVLERIRQLAPDASYLEIVVHRVMPFHLRTPPGFQCVQEVYVPSKLKVRDLFTFLDVSLQHRFLSRLQHETLRLSETHGPEGEKKETTVTTIPDFWPNSQEEQASYEQHMVVASSVPSVTLHVAHEVGEALVDALECVITGQIPRWIEAVHRKCAPDHMAFVRWRDTVQTLQYHVEEKDTGWKTLNWDQRRERVEPLLPLLAQLAVLRGALHNFADRWCQITSYEFMLHPGIFARLCYLIHTVQKLAQPVGKWEACEWVFSEKHSMHLSYVACPEASPWSVTLVDTPDLRLAGEWSLYVIHRPPGSLEPWLTAAAGLELAHVQKAYVLNLWNQSLEGINLPMDQRLGFLEECLAAKIQVHQRLTDAEFLTRFRVPGPLGNTPPSQITMQESTQEEGEHQEYQETRNTTYAEASEEDSS